jgi:ATP-dependent helicase/nuclease subunit A
MSGKVFPLKDNQALAVDPRDSVWLSASAGTGKTQVLSARVLRLLLREDVAPEQILCLTFTKAGAAEMAVRVNEVLANWVRMKPEALAGDLKAIGARFDPEAQARARTLFARVLDCPGGGLRIDTIHAFSQWLLAAFPEEAGLVPGTRPMEDRDRDLLAHAELARMVAEWEETGEAALTGALEMLSVRLSPDGTRKWLMRCAEAREAWFGSGGWQESDIAARVKGLIGLAADADAGAVAALCADHAFDTEALHLCLSANRAWGTKTAATSIAAIETWLAADPAARVALCDEMRGALFTLKDEPRQLKSLEKHEGMYAEAAAAVLASLARIGELQALLALADLLVPALTVGRRFALRWEEAKAREGLIDFDDQIRRAAALLDRADMAEWIRFKLDRRFDHILIDEAQDTNAAQWSIIRALTDDFFSGAGQREGRQRTIFVVGDYKQAIFGFQGTSPENFSLARDRFAELMRGAAASVRELARQTRDPLPEARELRDLGLGRSYRTAQPVLDFVDRAIAAIGPAQFGLKDDPEPHVGDTRPGEVVLWRPVSAASDEDADEREDDSGPEDWISEPERRMADRIADQVKAWLRDGYPLVKGGARKAGPGDVMVLVRKRRELAGLIVARLFAAGVPVAGVDRLRLGAPLAVKDLMAALRFAAQPLDDLGLANMLVSPLIGWSQQNLLDHAWRGDKVPLWDHLRRSDNPEAMRVAESLRDLLRLADVESPQGLLHWMLVGPWTARRKLVARLGTEANDPIDELLNAASAYAASNTASLQGFIRWFDAGEGELKREAGASEGLVRVMTVHGSKGLQAPIVILADAAGNPDSSPVRGLSLEEELPGGGGRTIPLPGLRKEEKVGRIAEAEAAAKASERQEHWRLLYVAMTRAEEALFLGGALGKREKEPAPDSWYARLLPLFAGEPDEDPIWGAVRRHGERPAPVAGAGGSDGAESPSPPAWALTPIGPEPRPPRPLAPSSAGEERGADPPLPPEAVALAARRGVLVHRLLERLPDVPVAERKARARAWLARQARDLDEGTRDELLASALAVLDHPDFARLFAPGALAEVPLAATVGGQVVAGFADRLLVTPGEVTVVDFKTARRPPASLAEVPLSTLRQMAAYAAALGEIYPGRRVRAGVLYTHAPRLIEIPAAVLAEHKAALSTAQESFAALPVE